MRRFEVGSNLRELFRDGFPTLGTGDTDAVAYFSVYFALTQLALLGLVFAFTRVDSIHQKFESYGMPGSSP